MFSLRFVFLIFSTGRIWIKKVQFGLPKVEEDTRLDGLSHLHGLGVVNLIRSTHRGSWKPTPTESGSRLWKHHVGGGQRTGLVWWYGWIWLGWCFLASQKNYFEKPNKTQFGEQMTFFSGNMFFHFFWGGGLVIFLPQLQNCYPSGWTSLPASWVGPIGWTGTP